MTTKTNNIANLVSSLATITGANVRDGSKTAERKASQHKRWTATVVDYLERLEAGHFTNDKGKKVSVSFNYGITLAMRVIELRAKLSPENKVQAPLPKSYLERYAFSAPGAHETLVSLGQTKKLDPVAVLTAFGAAPLWPIPAEPVATEPVAPEPVAEAPKPTKTRRSRAKKSPAKSPAKSRKSA
jgi:hypothetical protein